MHSSRYQSYILRSVVVSRQKLSGVHDCPSITGLNIQLSPMSIDQSRILGAASLLSILSGQSPCQLFKFSRRSKERKLSGGFVTLRGARALKAISSFKALSLFYSANFRGFKSTTPNKSSSFCPKHLSFFLGARRAFDTGLLGFEDNGIFCHFVISFSSPDYSDTITRGLRLPVYS